MTTYFNNNEILQVYTNTVQGYLNEGYMLSPTGRSIKGSELSHVELIKGETIISVYLLNKYGYDDYIGSRYDIGIEVTEAKLGKSSYRGNELSNSSKNSWTEKTVCCCTFYQIAENRYTQDKAEMDRINSIRKKREKAKFETDYVLRFQYYPSASRIDEKKAKSLVVPFIKRQKGFKSKTVTYEDIEKIIKRNNGTYDIYTTNGKSFILGANKAV